ncbi:MAG: phosphomannomutase [Isosphaeraceae bacterium]|jgi:phosphoglucomutase/phosphomannomutase|nr:MAG: phosphomannomutase [Isosphaeraceae bacterium]
MSSDSQTLLDRVTEAERAGQLSAAAARAIRRWLTEPPFQAYRELLAADIEAQNWKTLDDVFYTVMEFGTGGRRGRMYPVGTNALNARTIAESARGLADYITAKTPGAAVRSCAIAYDTRINSRSFAEICAQVLAAAGFQVHVFAEPRSTPLLSFAVRHLRCDCGIMITASHNPPADNGFKCYDADGNQVVPPDDAGIIEAVRAVSEREIPEVPLADALADGRVSYIRPEVESAYLAAVVSESVARARDIKIVYTPMHGVGETNVAAALKTDGFAHLNILASQRTPDGHFPNIPGHVANPEIPKTLEAAIAEARATGADLVLASDPDADRIGVAVPATSDPRGPWVTLDGNQIGALLAAFIMKQTEAMGRLRNDHYILTTLVSGQMVKALAWREGVHCIDDLLVGFKWIGKAIDANGHVGFLFAFEESHGYLKGDYIRDKDAAVAAMLFAELAAEVKDRKQTLLEYLDDLYIDVGHYAERLLNKMFEGRQGSEQMNALMRALREVPPTHIGGLAVSEIRDYKEHVLRRADGSEELLPEPSADLIIFDLAEPGCRFAVRPSGTEPKMKIYLFARSDTRGATDSASLAPIKQKTNARLDAMAADIEKYIQNALVEFGS